MREEGVNVEDFKLTLKDLEDFEFVTQEELDSMLEPERVKGNQDLK